MINLIFIILFYLTLNMIDFNEQVIAKWLKRSLWVGDSLCSNHSDLIEKNNFYVII